MNPDQRAYYEESSKFFQNMNINNPFTLKDLEKVTLSKDSSATAFQEEAIFKHFDIGPIPELHAVLQIAPSLSCLPDPRHRDPICLVVGADCSVALRSKGRNWSLIGCAHLTVPDNILWNRCVELHAEGSSCIAEFCHGIESG